MSELYIVGAGGLGRETYDAVLASSDRAVAFVDERLNAATCRGLPVIGLDDVPDGARFVVGIADPSVRRRLAVVLMDRGLVPSTVVHPRAGIGPGTRLGVGSVVLANTYVSSDVAVGAHTHINYNATVGHDTVLGERVTVLPGANVAGGVRIGDDVTVGSNACVLPGVELGGGCTVGAGAVVTRSFSDARVLVGVPARPTAEPRG